MQRKIAVDHIFVLFFNKDCGNTCYVRTWLQFGEAQIPEMFCGKSVKQQLGCDLVHADGWDFRFGTRGSYFRMILVMGVLLL
jgi:hypothetical protein